ncbi:MAG: class I SAM-dependent methyltransferase [Proteobacteria bacterium]|nr:class I SAM-dependent methyltransferase [Pseudomonadota bacterium]
METLCRFCGAKLKHTFVDLGVSPLANSYLKIDQMNQMEPFYPLHAYACEECFLVQLEKFETPDHIFSDYAYFSSFSDSWLQHAKTYVEMMIDRFGFNKKSQVIEIASNDGYLLQYFIEKGVPVMGIEPAANVAETAIAKGISTLIKFFGKKTALELVADGTQADLIIGNNVLAHVPDLNDFVGGLKVLLKPQGIITMEFPHLMRLIDENQFDTIYHEHFSYFSFLTVEKVFAKHGLVLFDVQEVPTHGGSLRIYARHEDDLSKSTEKRIGELRSREKDKRFDSIDYYLSFSEKVTETKRKLLEFLITAKGQGRSVVGYGAPAKGNTLLNYCGIRSDFLDYTVDRSPHKQQHVLPGTRIPIYPPDKIRETRPDYLLILPWNLKTEIMEQMAHVREWGCQFVTPIPELTIHA